MKRKVPIAVLVSVAVIGTAMTIFVDWAGERAAKSQFDLIANEAAERLTARIEQRIRVLDAAAAYMITAQAPLERGNFVTFLDALKGRAPTDGSLGVGFALLADIGQERAASEIIARNYSVARDVWPQTEQRLRTPILLLEPHTIENKHALGFDMYSESKRRAAIDRAMQTGKLAASAPVQLVQDDVKAKVPGFLAYLPVTLPPLASASAKGQPFQGFVYAPFRLGDLHQAAFANMNLPAKFQTVDVGADGGILAQSDDYASAKSVAALTASREIDVGGRTWVLTLVATPDFIGNNWRVASLLLGVVSLLLAAALATSTRMQFTAIENANKFADLSRQAQMDAERATQDKDLMLQEMKHRIKNSIARMLAIARQTASSSANLEEFTRSFFARLQSMAASQELLTRSHWDKADIGELLTAELSQVLGEDFSKDRLSGEPQLLNERATQALGLTFHELATNALKYGDVDGVRRGLAVKWFEQGDHNDRKLVIHWTEPHNGGVPPTTGKPEVSPAGFGSKLIALSVERELGGTIKRATDAARTLISIELPIRNLG